MEPIACRAEPVAAEQRPTRSERMHPSTKIARFAEAPWALALALYLVACGGCTKSGESGGPEPEVQNTSGGGTAASGAAPADDDPQTPLTGRRVLERMVAAYQSATSYADEGVLRHKVQLGEDRVDEAADFSLAWQRPDRLRMQVYQASVVCDGKQLWATLADLPGQVLELDAPEQLSLEALSVDPTLSSVLTGGIAGGLPALALLMSDKALDAFLLQADEPSLLQPAEWDGRPCHRVVMQRPDGALVAWVDQENYCLRRLDYPTDAMRKQYANQGEVRELELWADFRSAQLNQSIDPNAFRFEAPSEAQRVKRLVMVPQPPPLSELLGKRMPPFRFQDLTGRPVDLETLAGKVCVLDFWATWCGPCMQSLPNLNKAYQRFKDDDRVQFLAVSIDVSQVDNAKVQDTFVRAGFDIPIVRDLDQFARTAFGIQGIPNLFVLGPDGIVQDNEIGFNPRLATELPERLEKLLAGEDIYPDAAMRYAQRMHDYRRQFDEQQRAALAEPDAVPQAKIAPAAPPSQLRLERLWSFTELKRPGNVLVASRDAELDRLWVIEGFKSVAEISARGEKIAIHPLDIPRASVVSYLRTWQAPGGNPNFLGSASNQALLHLFDANWQRQFSFPEGENAELMDAQPIDLDGDGQVELVIGYWGVVGVQAITLEGQRLWQNRSIENVFRIATAPAGGAGQARVLCTHGGGTILPIDAQGNPQDEIVVPNRFVRTIASADLDGNGQADLCGLVITNSAQEDAIGIGLDGSELWTYTLPAGVHEEPIEPIQSGRLLDEPGAQWILAAADGSVHILNSQGQLLDRFATGKRLCGLAATQIDGEPVLILSTNEGVEAWAVR